MIFFSILGFFIIVIVLGDVFETIVLPRRVSRRIRLARLFYRALWKLWRRGPKLFELGFFGPLSLILLLGFWTIALITGFAFFNFGLQDLQGSHGTEKNFLTYLDASGSTFFPVGIMNARPQQQLGRFVFIIEAGTGFALFALVIGYLPVIYEAFSRREVNINLLDSRAGSPPNALYLIERLSDGNIVEEIKPQLEKWEEWCAELLETHISYPVLAYYRSQHDNQSWVAALLLILDASALILASKNKVLHNYAKSTFAIARHSTIDLAQVFFLTPQSSQHDRLTKKDFKTISKSLKKFGLPLLEESEAEKKLTYLRTLYEPYIQALSSFFLMPITPFISKEEVEETWRRRV